MTHPIHRVARFDIVGPYTLSVAFTDGTTQEIDFRPVLHGALFGPLRDLAMFNAVIARSGSGHPDVAERRRLRSGDASRVASRVLPNSPRGLKRGRNRHQRTAGQHANGADAPLKWRRRAAHSQR